ncbi:MAG: hypothetical protein QN152_12530 [Armatimonadota bacterium]|nr:hypothetical protein [Armatimonadota bacterium]MDR7464831.1 hypothetical protein [Armatimonadota bacterium]MDR7470777.1 hypothetical protein [Armatimonadota bacterium]MDR7540334.1 hypothetical protein [Armatimonadota bacterium]
MRRTVKRLVRAGIRAARNWLREEPPDENYERDAFAYPYLNAILRKVFRDVQARPDYAWGVMQGAHLAKAVGTERIGVIEFGVAGGRGLIALELIAEQVERHMALQIDVYGFDTGSGLPKPRDHRDLPNLYYEGAYPMDPEKLRRRLRRAQLVLGFVNETLARFIASAPPPIAFAAFDLDLYSSTMDALKLFDFDSRFLLPRVHCYFDDIIGFTFGECNGELLAIADFNASHDMRKIARLQGLRHFVPIEFADQPWTEKFYLAHIFDHPAYGVNDGLVRRASLGLDENILQRIR